MVTSLSKRFSNDNKIYSHYKYPCSSMPSLLIMDLKYMLKSVNTMVGEFIEFICKIVDLFRIKEFVRS